MITEQPGNFEQPYVSFQKHGTMVRRSHRVSFAGGNGHELAGIVDLPPDQIQRLATDEAPEEQQRSIRTTPGTPVVVFSHCFTCNKDLKAIVRIGRSLAEQGIAVLRFDMTGLGHSQGKFSDTSFSSNLADLLAAIRFAETHLGPVNGLLGHSFGGAASLALAGMRSDKPTALKAVATLAAPSDTHHLSRLLEHMNPTIETHGFGDVEIGGRVWTIRREMLADFRSHRLEDRISKIDVPLMVIHSPSDRTVGFEHAIRIMQLASIRREATDGPPVSLVALDGADHLLAEQPEDLVYVSRLLGAFFWRHRT